MKILDVNLLLYATNEDFPQHRRAVSFVEAVFSSDEAVGLAPAVLVAFLRLATRHGLFRFPLSIDEACEIVQQWVAQPNVTLVHPTERHVLLMQSLLAPLGIGGNLVSDAHLAALAIEHNAEVCSADRDFLRFPGVRVNNPLL